MPKPIVQIYSSLVIKGEKKIDDVPEVIRNEVKEEVGKSKK